MYSPDDFSYELPPQLIAAYPTLQRSDSRLLCLDKQTASIEHKKFKDILSLLHPGDLLVLNDTKVIPARLFSRKPTGGKVEILVERILDNHCVLAHVKSCKTLKIGTELTLENQVKLKVSNKIANLFELTILDKVDSVLNLLDEIGHIPLPPYMQRADEAFDKARYQTIYARHPGAIAAPTAGLHFDENLFFQLKNKGVNLGFITLHVGAGTFQPMRTEKIEDHIMHAECVNVSALLCQQIIETKRQGKRVIAVGTTTVRSLETAAMRGFIEPFQGQTRLFIYPGFAFQCVDGLITNFHLPKSTLLMLVCAFGGYKPVMEVYQQAVMLKYRFFSYGDALWIS